MPCGAPPTAPARLAGGQQDEVRRLRPKSLRLSRSAHIAARAHNLQSGLRSAAHDQLALGFPVSGLPVTFTAMAAASLASSAQPGAAALRSGSSRRRSGARPAAARRVVVVRADARVANKQLLEVARTAAAAGAKVCTFWERTVAVWCLQAPPQEPPSARGAHRRRCPSFPPSSPLLPLAPLPLQIVMDAVDLPRNVQYKGTTDLVTDTGERGGEAKRRFLSPHTAPGHPQRNTCCALLDPPAPGADTSSEAAILSVIQAAFPGHAVLGEEGGVSGEAGCAGREAGH